MYAVSLRHIALISLLLLCIGCSAEGQPPAEGATAAAAQKAQWMREQSNWGRWGASDELGTLNLVTPEVRKLALALATAGEVVSLSRDIVPRVRLSDVDAQGRPIMTNVGEVLFRRDNVPPAGEEAVPGSGGGNVDMVTFAYHGTVYTHIDGLCHIAYEGRLYNGYLHEDAVDPDLGCLQSGIENVKSGIVTRGVLIDFLRLRDVDALLDTERLTQADVEAWEAMTGITIAAGDAVFLYTGWQEGEANSPVDYDASLVTLFRERDITLLGADRPAGDHHLFLTALGAYLIDNASLGPLAAAAARLNRWEFLLVVAPIPTPGATGSIANPLAIF
jgi:hypothetical protein